ncbi:MAG: response regulator [bacterium]
MNQFEEKLRANDTDGVLVVARTLVQTCVQDVARVAELAEKARYAQLLAGRLRLPVVETHKVALAAWLTGLADSKELVDGWVKEHDLGAILGTADVGSADVQQATGREILEVIDSYQSLRRDNPQAADPNVARRELRKLWATNPRRQSILSKFILVLNDEVFLKGLEAPVAKVLVVDPSEVVSSMLSLPLKKKGYNVTVAGNAQEGTTALLQEIPDAVIAEMDMPIESGLDLCTKIKGDQRTRHVPVILLTSSKSQRVFRECMKAGAEDVLGRPVDIELVFIKLQKILGARASKPQQSGIAGSLKDIVLSDLVQILCAGGKSAKIEFANDGDRGILHIREGEVIEAETGELRAENAFYELMTWKEGTFSATPCDQDQTKTIQLSVMSLLMEAARRNDEGMAG